MSLMRPRGGGGSVPRRVPAEGGVWVFIFGDLCIFAFVFLLFVSARAQDPELFRQSQQALSPDLGMVNTFLLLTSSLFVVIGVRAVRSGLSEIAPKLFVGALVCGSCFVLVKILEYREKIHSGLKPTTNDFYLWYYLMTGLHLFHLIVGMGAITLVWSLSRRPAPTGRNVVLVEAGACFWHLIDLLWIIIFPLLYLVK
jgi:nitric oxide reductase NorE protein